MKETIEDIITLILCIVLYPFHLIYELLNTTFSYKIVTKNLFAEKIKSNEISTDDLNVKNIISNKISTDNLNAKKISTNELSINNLKIGQTDIKESSNGALTTKYKNYTINLTPPTNINNSTKV